MGAVFLLSTDDTRRWARHCQLPFSSSSFSPPMAPETPCSRHPKAQPVTTPGRCRDDVARSLNTSMLRALAHPLALARPLAHLLLPFFFFLTFLSPGSKGCRDTAGMLPGTTQKSRDPRDATPRPHPATESMTGKDITRRGRQVT